MAAVAEPDPLQVLTHLIHQGHHIGTLTLNCKENPYSYSLVLLVMGSSNFDNSPESSMNPLDPEEFRRQGYMVIDFLADYYKNIEKYPVLSQVQPGYLSERLPESAPNSPERIDTILRDVQNHIFPGITHWQNPNFFAYFPASHSIAGFVGEMLTSGFNVPGFNWISSPAATELEQIVMDWLGKLIQLPRSFLFSGNGGGVIHVTTCEAILCTLVAARERMLDQIGAENIEKLIVYCSDQTHSTCQKATKIAGIRPENFRAIKTNKSKMFALCPNSLEKAISKDVEAGLVPFFLCATLGTTATTAVDPLRQLLKVTKRFGMWVHVDAAYAGSSLICPEFQHFIDGIEDVDSFSLNPHKWLLTTLTCCCLWVKDTNCLKKPLTTTPEYLQNKASSTGEVVDYKDWQVSVSRRFQALKLWLVLRSYGVANLRTFLRRHVEMAKHLESLIAQDKRFEVVVPVNFSLVCFRLLPLKMHIGSTNGFEIRLEEEEDVANEMNKELLESINDSGQAFMTHAVVGGMFVIRVAIGATLPEHRHVAMSWKLVQETATRILGSSN